MDNLDIYNALRQVPATAQKTIGAGRLKGMTDINPMWRIKALTERFGPVGAGWFYTIKREWTERCEDTKEVCAFVDIDLYYVVDGKTSMPIPGTGGSKLVSAERNGLYVSDECYKMALTDAISVAAKALGVGADIYWSADRDKYTADEPSEPKATIDDIKFVCTECGNLVQPVTYNGREYSIQDVDRISRKKFGKCVCWACMSGGQA